MFYSPYFEIFLKVTNEKSCSRSGMSGSVVKHLEMSRSTLFWVLTHMRNITFYQDHKHELKHEEVFQHYQIHNYRAKTQKSERTEKAKK